MLVVGRGNQYGLGTRNSNENETAERENTTAPDAGAGCDLARRRPGNRERMACAAHSARPRVEAAIQREYSQVLAISEKQINHKANELVDDVRTEFPEPGEACSVTLDRILAAHPYVAHIFVFTPGAGIVFRSQAAG